jgi:hypothetical protein
MMTGWEHDVPEDDSILRQWVLTNLTRYRMLVERVRGRTDVWDGAALFDTGSTTVFDNAAVLRRPPSATELDELIDTAHIFFSADRPWLLLSAWPLPDLGKAGLQRLGHPPFMMRPAGAPVEARPTVVGLEIHEMTPDLAPLFAQTLEAGFEMPGAAASPWSKPAAFGPDMLGYIGYVNGEPVATASAFLAHGVVDVEGVSCVEAHRGRGIGEAMTWAATLADPARPAMLMASDLGRPIYDRMGYLSVLRMTLWFSPAEEVSAS